MKPIIGLTGTTLNSFLPKLNKGNSNQKEVYVKILSMSTEFESMYGFNENKIQFTFENDIKAIENAGGIPVILPALSSLEDLDALLNRLDGILITGGYDIHPMHYGEEDQHSKGLLGNIETLEDEDAGLFAKFSEQKDTQEMMLVKLAHERQIPVMGICRGSQVINVAMGGSLYQDILLQKASVNKHTLIEKWNTAAHAINIEKDTMLHRLLGRDSLSVNSIHHQSIKAVGKGLRVAATAEDGIIECIESTGEGFILGVQWHPEMLSSDSEQQKLFKHFLAACQSAKNA